MDHNRRGKKQTKKEKRESPPRRSQRHTFRPALYSNNETKKKKLNNKKAAKVPDSEVRKNIEAIDSIEEAKHPGSGGSYGGYSADAMESFRHLPIDDVIKNPLYTTNIINASQAVNKIKEEEERVRIGREMASIFNIQPIFPDSDTQNEGRQRLSLQVSKDITAYSAELNDKNRQPSKGYSYAEIAPLMDDVINDGLGQGSKKVQKKFKTDNTYWENSGLKTDKARRQVISNTMMHYLNGQAKVGYKILKRAGLNQAGINKFNAFVNIQLAERTREVNGDNNMFQEVNRRKNSRVFNAIKSIRERTFKDIYTKHGGRNQVAFSKKDGARVFKKN